MKKHPLANLDDDIRDHIERETQDNIERGMSEQEARYAALRKFGNVTLVQEDTRAVWIPAWMDQLRQDVRYAARTVRRAPGFAAIAVGSSALGIGVCAVMFAILNAAIFRPLPVDQPGGLMSVSQSDRRTGDVGNELSYPDFMDLRGVRSFEGIAAYNPLLPVSMGGARRSAATLGLTRDGELLRGSEAGLCGWPRLRCQPGRHTWRPARCRAEP